jgi:8-oxo-dGTP diphosphatase
LERALVFGAKLPGLDYHARPGAYALVFDATGRVAIVYEDDAWYLPGGGLEPGETPEQALAREIREECACGIELAAPFAEAIEYLVTRAGRPLEMRAYYFHARFAGAPTATWLPPTEACARVRRQSDAWAITAARDESAARLRHP